MTYVAKSPELRNQGIGNQGVAHWYHQSADTGATVQVSGFITDGGDLGMKVNDLVTHLNTGTGVISDHVVVTVSSTAPGAVDLSDSTTIGSGTNSN